MNLFDILSDWLEEEGYVDKGFELIIGGLLSKEQVLVHSCRCPGQGIQLGEDRLNWDFKIINETRDSLEVVPRKNLLVSDPEFFSKLGKMLDNHICYEFDLGGLG